MPGKELAKAFESQQYEDAIYKRWEESGFFNPDTYEGTPYAIMMPPPNVTGVLHLGHALENTLMDTMARFQRMQGKKVLLVPGTDHAALPTQAKVEKMLMKEGIKYPRQEFGREKLVEKIREFAEQSKATILGQVRKMGTSCDWSRLAYTFDTDRNIAVNELFCRMYNDGLIYRGYRVVNWSVKGQSTCSDDELIHIERPGKMYYFKYSHDFPITIASTRPETKLGDTAVAVHPNDERYKQFIGQEFVVDVGAEKPRTIKIIADENVEKELGTGALGVTPAHSPIDFEMYVKQKAVGNDIGIIPVVGADGRMTEAAGAAYVGLSVEEAREKFVAWLRDQNLLEKEEDVVQNVATSDRFGDVIEPIPMTQWWLDMNKSIPGREKSLKDLMREAVTTGLNNDAAQKVRIAPVRFEKLYLDRIENLRDWCLSRQIWWGHRIPVWYKNEEMYVGTSAPEGEGWTQDEDTLDTWFSSGSWTFSTLGWPEQTKDLQTFHPTAWMQMGYEILYLWMMRMILMSTYCVQQIPFRDVYIHGILRDEHGKKFSKSADNGIDPLDVIEKYGCDALRFAVINGISPGNDSRFYTEKVEGARNLVNKIWNISRYVLMNIEAPRMDIAMPEVTRFEDKWILEKVTQVQKNVEKYFNQFEFSQAGDELRAFTWNELADWYVEFSKGAINAEVMNYVLNTTLKLWHPFLPFVTETLWREMYGEEVSLMTEKWDTVEAPRDFESAYTVIEKVKEIVVAIRTIKNDYSIVKAKKVTIHLDETAPANVQDFVHSIERIAGVESVEFGAVQSDEFVASHSFIGGVVSVHLTGEIDIEKEKARLQKEIAHVAPYVAAQEKKLSNVAFVDNAPAAVVEEEKKKLEEAKQKLEKYTEQLSAFSA